MLGKRKNVILNKTIHRYIIQIKIKNKIKYKISPKCVFLKLDNRKEKKKKKVVCYYYVLQFSYFCLFNVLMFNNRAPHQILIDHYSSICMFISEAVYFSNKIVQNQDFVQKDFRPESKTEMKGPSKFINNPSIAMVQVWEAKILLPPPLTHLTYMSRLKLI